MNTQGWTRQVLRRAASLLTPNELTARVAVREAISDERYGEIAGTLDTSGGRTITSVVSRR